MIKVHSVTFSFQIIAIVFVCLVHLNALSIPENEEDAHKMISTGELDSILWNMIEPYYNQPISVPDGELDILLKIFPNLSENLPVTEQQLASFVPWTKRNIEKFYSLWPELRDFKPLLDFSEGGPVNFGKVGFFINKSTTTNFSSQHLQFDLSPVRQINVRGRILVGQQYARWNTRQLTINPVPWCSLRAGDVQPLHDDGLILGYFKKNAIQDSTILSNWLYGDARGWNSIVLKIGLLTNENTLILQPFVHKRVSEMSAGFTGGFDVRKKFKNELSLLALDVKEQHDTTFFCMYRGLLTINTGSVQLATCTPLGGKPVLPLSLKTTFKNDKNEMKTDVVFIPTGYKSARSLLLSTFGDAELIQQAILSDLLHARCSFRHNFTSFSILPEFTANFYDYTMTSISTGIQISGEYDPVQYQFHYRWSGDEYRDTLAFHHKYSINLTMSKLVWFDAGIHFTCRIDEGKGVSLQGSLFPSFRVNSGLTISPFLDYDKSMHGTTTVSIGMTQRMSLFESTYSDVSVEREMVRAQKGIFRINAKMWFLF